MASRADHRSVANHRTTVAVARKDEIACCVLAKQREVRRMNAVRHRQGATEAIAGFCESFLGISKDNVAQVDLVSNAGRRCKT